MNTESGPHPTSSERHAIQVPVIPSPDRRQTMSAISPENIRKAVGESNENALTDFFKETDVRESEPNNPEHFAQDHITIITQEDIRRASERAETTEREANKGGALARARKKIMELFIK